MSMKLIALFSASIPAASTLAQPLSCGLRSAALAYSVESVGYQSFHDTDWLPALAGGMAVANAAGSSGSNGCATSSSIRVESGYARARIDGSGSATNCYTDAGTIYAMGDRGALSHDRLEITSSTLPAGTQVPVRVRVTFVGDCTSIQPSPPYCGSRFRLDLNGSFGPFVLQSTSPGVFEGVTSVGVVGSYLQVDCGLYGFAGASTSALQHPSGPSTTVTCSVNTAVSFTIKSLDPRAALTSCSGHNYAIPFCPADFNGDGAVDFFDYDDFVLCFENITCPPGTDADFDQDGTVDFFDYDGFVLAFETGC